MAAATAVEASALDELRFVLEGVFARIEQFERPAPTSLHSLYTALYHLIAVIFIFYFTESRP